MNVPLYQEVIYREIIDIRIDNWLTWQLPSAVLGGEVFANHCGELISRLSLPVLDAYVLCGDDELHGGVSRSWQ